MSLSATTSGLPVTTGERVERDGYAYCDLVMAENVA